MHLAIVLEASHYTTTPATLQPKQHSTNLSATQSSVVSILTGTSNVWEYKQRRRNEAEEEEEEETKKASRRTTN